MNLPMLPSNFFVTKRFSFPQLLLKRFYSEFKYCEIDKKLDKYQPSGAWGTRSPPAMPHRLQRRTACNAAPPHRLQSLNWPPVGPKMADEVWKGVYP